MINGRSWRSIFQHRKVSFRVAADQSGQGFSAILQGHDDLISTVDHMVIGQQVAFRTHDYRRAEAGFHAPLLGQVVAEELAKLRILEQRMCGFIDEFGGV